MAEISIDPNMKKTILSFITLAITTSTIATPYTETPSVFKQVPSKRIYQPDYLIKKTDQSQVTIHIQRKKYLNGIIDCPSLIYFDKKKIISLHSFEETTLFLNPDRYYIKYAINNSGCINLEFYQNVQPEIDIMTQERLMLGEHVYEFSIGEETKPK
jgi:hypothetical protein